MSMQSPIGTQSDSSTATVPPTAPTLPHQDTPAERAVRAAQLVAIRTHFVWDAEVASLPGVPLAAAVPLDNLTTLGGVAHAYMCLMT